MHEYMHATWCCLPVQRRCQGLVHRRPKEGKASEENSNLRSRPPAIYVRPDGSSHSRSLHLDGACRPQARQVAAAWCTH